MERERSEEAKTVWEPFALSFLIWKPNTYTPTDIKEWAAQEDTSIILVEWKQHELDSPPHFLEVREFLSGEPRHWRQGANNVTSLMSQLLSGKKSKNDSRRFTFLARWAEYAARITKTSGFLRSKSSKSASDDLNVAYRLLLDALLDLQANPSGFFSELLGKSTDLTLLDENDEFRKRAREASKKSKAAASQEVIVVSSGEEDSDEQPPTKLRRRLDTKKISSTSNATTSGASNGEKLETAISPVDKNTKNLPFSDFFFRSRRDEFLASDIMRWASAQSVLLILKDFKAEELDKLDGYRITEGALGNTPRRWTDPMNCFIIEISKINSSSSYVMQGMPLSVNFCNRWAPYIKDIVADPSFFSTSGKSFQETTAAYFLIMTMILDLQHPSPNSYFKTKLGGAPRWKFVKPVFFTGDKKINQTGPKSSSKPSPTPQPSCDSLKDEVSIQDNNHIVPDDNEDDFEIPPSLAAKMMKSLKRKRPFKPVRAKKSLDNISNAVSPVPDTTPVVTDDKQKDVTASHPGALGDRKGSNGKKAAKPKLFYEEDEVCESLYDDPDVVRAGVPGNYEALKVAYDQLITKERATNAGNIILRAHLKAFQEIEPDAEALKARLNNLEQKILTLEAGLQGYEDDEATES